MSMQDSDDVMGQGRQGGGLDQDQARGQGVHGLEGLEPAEVVLQAVQVERGEQAGRVQGQGLGGQQVAGAARGADGEGVGDGEAKVEGAAEGWVGQLNAVGTGSGAEGNLPQLSEAVPVVDTVLGQCRACGFRPLQHADESEVPCQPMAAPSQLLDLIGSPSLPHYSEKAHLCPPLRSLDTLRPVLDPDPQQPPPIPPSNHAQTAQPARLSHLQLAPEHIAIPTLHPTAQQQILLTLVIGLDRLTNSDQQILLRQVQGRQYFNEVLLLV